MLTVPAGRFRAEGRGGLQGQLDAALADFGACLQADPRHCRALYSRARTLQRLGRWAAGPSRELCLALMLVQASALAVSLVWTPGSLRAPLESCARRCWCCGCRLQS